MTDYSAINAARKSFGFRTVEQTLEFAQTNSLLDPFSTLLPVTWEIGNGNIFFPGVVIKCTGDGTIQIGSNNVFHPGTIFEATFGSISVGSQNIFGEGGFIAKANQPGAKITIGSLGRYVGGPTVMGSTILGDGCQILGNINVNSCQLDSGNAFSEEDPDLRGAVLKGYGNARSVHVPKGHVIAGNGTFQQSDLLPQTHFHPKPE